MALSETLLKRRVELDAERQKKESEARKIKAEIDQLDEQIAAGLTKLGKREAKRGAFRAFFDEVAGRVQWRAEYIKQMKDGDVMPTAEPKQRLRVVSTAAAMLCCVLLSGCLVESSAPAAMFDDAGSADPFADIEGDHELPVADYVAPAGTPAGAVAVQRPIIRQLPPATQQKPKPDRFCLVYTDPETCRPCQYLEHDLKYACRPDGWSCGDVDSGADFRLTTPADGMSVPRFEFYDGGELVDVWTGYTQAAQLEQRLDVLREIVRKHPLSKSYVRR